MSQKKYFRVYIKYYCTNTGLHDIVFYIIIQRQTWKRTIWLILQLMLLLTHHS